MWSLTYPVTLSCALAPFPAQLSTQSVLFKWPLEADKDRKAHEANLLSWWGSLTFECDIAPAAWMDGCTFITTLCAVRRNLSLRICAPCTLLHCPLEKCSAWIPDVEDTGFELRFRLEIFYPLKDRNVLSMYLCHLRLRKLPFNARAQWLCFEFGVGKHGFMLNKNKINHCRHFLWCLVVLIIKVACAQCQAHVFYRHQ